MVSSGNTYCCVEMYKVSGESHDRLMAMPHLNSSELKARKTVKERK